MRTWPKLALLLGSLLIAALLVPGSAAATTKHTQRVSVSSAGVQGNADSGNYPAAISANGRYVAFDSAASNLVSGDSNGYVDVFVRDRKLHKTYLVSVSSAGVQGNGVSYAPAISANGRYVAFDSAASNLVSGDSNGYIDIFVRDRKLHKTFLVSVSSAGIQANGNSGDYAAGVSADGRYVAFDSAASNLTGADTNGYQDVFVRDRKLHRTSRVSVSSAGVQGNAESYTPAISADGRYVAFESAASNLVGGDSNGYFDVFVRDRKLHRTVRASVTAGVQGNGPSEGPAISADGRYVSFVSSASDLVSGDTNGYGDIFVRGPYH
jgi:Tol biopolymer transport system component